MHYLYFEIIYLNFEYVTDIDVSEKAVKDQDFPWLSIIDEKYNPFWNKDYLIKHFGEDVLACEDFSDTDKCSYIVTIGRPLCLIGYKLCEARTKYFGLIPRQYIGKVSLSDEIDNSKIYVYRIKKSIWLMINMDLTTICDGKRSNLYVLKICLVILC